MSAEIICDGCGKRKPMVAGKDGNWHKPASWFERSDEDGIQTACCRKCIDATAAKTGKSSTILPL